MADNGFSSEILEVRPSSLSDLNTVLIFEDQADVIDEIGSSVKPVSSIGALDAMSPNAGANELLAGHDQFLPARGLL